MKDQETKARLLKTLSRHVGAEKALGMAELFETVYQRPVGDRINDTRELRKLITRLRLDGVPIASVSRPEGGGYYLAGIGSELEDYLARLRRRGLKALVLEAKIRNIGLGELLSRAQLTVEREGRVSAE